MSDKPSDRIQPGNNYQIINFLDEHHAQLEELRKRFAVYENVENLRQEIKNVKAEEKPQAPAACPDGHGPHGSYQNHRTCQLCGKILLFTWTEHKPQPVEPLNKKQPEKLAVAINDATNWTLTIEQYTKASKAALDAVKRQLDELAKDECGFISQATADIITHILKEKLL